MVVPHQHALADAVHRKGDEMTIISENILHGIAGGCILVAAMVADGGIILSAVLFGVAAVCIGINYALNGEI